MRLLAPSYRSEVHNLFGASKGIAQSKAGRLCGFCRALAFLLPCTAFCQTKAASEASSAHPDRYQIVHVYPHDPSAYTQGLVYMEGRLYESTGLNGRSSVQMVDLAGGKVCSATIFLRNILEKV